MSDARPQREQVMVDRRVFEQAMAVADAVRMWRGSKGAYWGGGSARERETVQAVLEAEESLLSEIESLDIYEEFDGYYSRSRLSEAPVSDTKMPAV